MKSSIKNVYNKKIENLQGETLKLWNVYSTYISYHHCNLKLNVSLGIHEYVAVIMEYGKVKEVKEQITNLEYQQIQVRIELK